MAKAATARRVEAFKYEEHKKQSQLTAKWYLVYSYLLSISKWDAQTKENHYHVYKNSFKIKEAVEQIGITQPTWRTAIKKLIEFHYIKDLGDNYQIILKEPYAPLQIGLIKYLIGYGKALTKAEIIDEENGEITKGEQQGGNIIAVYSLLYRYWDICQNSEEECCITINQLKSIFKAKRDKGTTMIYKMILGVFLSNGLIGADIVSKDGPKGPYHAYRIKWVLLDLPKALQNEENSDDKIDNILQKVHMDLNDVGGILQLN